MAANKPTNRREALRARQAAEARRHRRNRALIVVAGFVVLALIVVIIITSVNRNKTPYDQQTPTSSQVDPPDGDAQRAWITVPSSNTKSGALIVDAHFDYQCPGCDMAENAYGVMFDQLSDRGDIVLRYHTHTFLDNNLQNDSSTRAAVAAACVDVADNSKYAAYSNVIFANQPPSDKEGQGYTDAQLRSDFASRAGLSGDALTAFQQCYDKQATLQWVRDVNTNNVGLDLTTAGFPKYLFGGNQPNVDTTGNCTGTKGGPVGVCSTPTFYVQGVQFTLTDIFNTDKSQKANNADELLSLLQQLAQG